MNNLCLLRYQDSKFLWRIIKVTEYWISLTDQASSGWWEESLLDRVGVGDTWGRCWYSWGEGEASGRPYAAAAGPGERPVRRRRGVQAVACRPGKLRGRSLSSPVPEYPVDWWHAWCRCICTYTCEQSYTTLIHCNQKCLHTYRMPNLQTLT